MMTMVKVNICGSSKSYSTAQNYNDKRRQYFINYHNDNFKEKNLSSKRKIVKRYFWQIKD
jgi:hypothetical protein